MVEDELFKMAKAVPSAIAGGTRQQRSRIAMIVLRFTIQLKAAMIRTSAKEESTQMSGGAVTGPLSDDFPRPSIGAVRVLPSLMTGTHVQGCRSAPIDSRRMMIRVERGKGGAGRDLPLSPALLETLCGNWRWKKPRAYLFPSSTGHRGPDKPISDKTVWYACKEAALHARITKHVTPHTLRHSWAIIYRVPVIESNSNIKVTSWSFRCTWQSQI